MQLSINGQERQFPDLNSGAALTKLIEVLQMKSDRIAVERNGLIVPRPDWDRTLLSDGDRLEIVQFVGGGS